MKKNILFTLLLLPLIFTGCKDHEKTTVEKRLQITVNFPGDLAGDKLNTNARTVAPSEYYEEAKEEFIYKISCNRNGGTEIYWESDELSYDDLDYLISDSEDFPYGNYQFNLNVYTSNEDFDGQVGLSAECNVTLLEDNAFPPIIFDLEEVNGFVKVMIPYNPMNGVYFFPTGEERDTVISFDNLSIKNSTTSETIDVTTVGSLDGDTLGRNEASSGVGYIDFSFALPDGIYDIKGNVVIKDEETELSSLPFAAYSVIVRGGLLTLLNNFKHPSYRESNYSIIIAVDADVIPSNSISTYYPSNNFVDYGSFSSSEESSDVTYSFNSIKNRHEFKISGINKAYLSDRGIRAPCFNRIYVDGEYLYFYGYYYDKAYTKFFVDEIQEENDYSEYLDEFNGNTVAVASKNIPEFDDEIVIYARFEKPTTVYYHVDPKYGKGLKKTLEEIPYSPNWKIEDNTISHFSDNTPLYEDETSGVVGLYKDSALTESLSMGQITEVSNGFGMSGFGYAIEGLPYREVIDIYIDIADLITLRNIYDNSSESPIKVEAYGSGNYFKTENKLEMTDDWAYWVWEYYTTNTSASNYRVFLKDEDTYGEGHGWKIIRPNGEEYVFPEVYDESVKDVILECLDENHVLYVYPNIDRFDQDYMVVYNVDDLGLGNYKYTLGLTQPAKLGLYEPLDITADSRTIQSITSNSINGDLYYLRDINDYAYVYKYNLESKSETEINIGSLQLVDNPIRTSNCFNSLRVDVENPMNVYILNQASQQVQMYSVGDTVKAVLGTASAISPTPESDPYPYPYPYGYYSSSLNKWVKYQVTSFDVKNDYLVVAYKKTINDDTKNEGISLRKYVVGEEGYYPSASDKSTEFAIYGITDVDRNDGKTSISTNLLEESILSNPNCKIVDVAIVNDQLYGLISCLDYENGICTGGLFRMGMSKQGYYDFELDTYYGNEGLVTTSLNCPQKILSVKKGEVVIADADFVFDEMNGTYSIRGKIVKINDSGDSYTVPVRGMNFGIVPAETIVHEGRTYTYSK